MANSLFGGFMESLGPAMQQGREGALKQQMLKMQMQQFEAQNRKAQAEAALQQQQDQLSKDWQVADTPEKKRAVMERGALLKGDYSALQKMSVSARDPMDFIKKYDQYEAEKNLTPSGGQEQGDNPYAAKRQWDPSIGSEGEVSFKGSMRQPTGKQAEVEGLLFQFGLNSNNKAALIDASSIVNAPPGEAQSMLLDRFRQKYGGSSGQPRSPSMSQPTATPPAGLDVQMPNGQRVKFDSQETFDEYQAMHPDLAGQLVPQGQPQPSPRYAGPTSSVPGGSVYDQIRGKETAATIERAGGTERARTLNEGLSKEERLGIGATQSVRNAVEDLGKAWEPGFTGMESLGGTLREKTGLMGRKEAQFRTIYNNLKRLDIRASAGLSQTASEMENAIAALGEPGLADPVFQERLGTLRNILDQAQAIDEQLLTAPRSAVPGILQQQRSTRQPYGERTAQPPKQASGLAVGSQVEDLAGIPDNATFRDESGRLFKKVNGKKMPWGGK